MEQVNYKIKCKPDDFIVTEVPLEPELSNADAATYTYFELQKIGLTTFDAEEEIARFFGVARLDVEAQGLKDEDGVTSQMMSIKKILSEKDLVPFNDTYRRGDFTLQIRRIHGYGKKPVRPRLLHGNKFRIVIRHLEERMAKQLYNFCLTNRSFSYVNYYDKQRFGIAGGPYNTPLIGKAIVEGHWRQAYAEYQQSGHVHPDQAKTLDDADKCKAFFKSLDQRRVSFFVASYNSLLWNKAASSKLAESTEGYQHHFEHVGTLFVPANLVFRHHNLCSIRGYALQDNEFAITRKQKERVLVVTTNVYPLELGQDELHPNKWQVKVGFYNPTGCYATMLIQQLIFKLV